VEWTDRRTNDACDGLKEGGMKLDRRVLKEDREVDENKTID